MGNNSLAINLLINVPIFIILFLSMYFINDFKGNGSILFGIRIPKDFSKDSRVLIIKNKYKMNITLSSAVLFMIGILLTKYSPQLSTLVAVFGMIIFSTIFYFLSYKKLLALKTNENWSELSSKKVYISLSSPREENIISLWWFVVPITFAIINLIIILFNINSLPESVILHIGFNGPDRFGNGAELSTKLEILLLPILNLIVVGINFFAIKNQLKQADKLNGGTVEEVKSKNFKSKKQTILLTFITSLIISMMLTMISLYCIRIIDLSLPLLLTISFSPVFILLIAMPLFIKANKEKEIVSANANEENIYIDDDNPYKFGGLFYYNKNNPSTWIPKRMGIGYTINFATLGGKSFIIIIFALVIFAIAVS